MKPYDLSVSVSPRFVPEQSDPGEHQFVFAYTVRITNTGEHPAQVISRHWIITDGNQRVQEVRGLGVVGQQPLAPGETFEYTSGCPLPTPVGTMRGTYHCVGENGIPFEVPISESWRCRVPCTDAARRLFFWPMKRILCLSVIGAACRVHHHLRNPLNRALAQAYRPRGRRLLRVPSLSALADTPRALAGKLKPASWAEMPGWSNDDLSQFWPLFIRIAG